MVVWIGNMKEGRGENQTQICAAQTTGMCLEVGALWTLGRWNPGCRSEQPAAASSLFQGQWGRRQDY